MTASPLCTRGVQRAPHQHRWTRPPGPAPPRPQSGRPGRAGGHAELRREGGGVVRRPRAARAHWPLARRYSSMLLVFDFVHLYIPKDPCRYIRTTFANLLVTSGKIKRTGGKIVLAALEALEAAGGSGNTAGRVALPEQVPEGNVCGAIGKCWPTRCSSFT